MRFPRLLIAAALLLAVAAAPAATAASAQRTWHGAQIRMYDAFAAGFDGRGITIAVLDSWIDRTHPHFDGRAAAGADCTSGTCTATMGRDGCGQEHGTHVAGTAASSSYGVARRARLLPVRVLKDDGNGDCIGDPDVVAAGIRWAVNAGARVLNLSLGPDVPGLATTSAIPTAVREAASRGAVVVFSAGNSSQPVAQAYGDDALVVAATNRSGGLADYSQRGQGVSVAAPGGEGTGGACKVDSCVLSLYPGGKAAVAAGTSMAAPHVAGLAAMLLQKGLSRQQVIDRITSTAVPVAGAGAGRIDVRAALGIQTVRPAPKPSPTRKPVVVRPRVVPPAQAAPTKAPTKPSPVAIAPSPQAPSPLPTQVTTSTPSSPAVVAAPSPVEEEPIPIPLAAVAGMLVGLAATGVLVLPRL